MSLLLSGLAGSGSQEEGAILTWTGGHTTGEGESTTITVVLLLVILRVLLRPCIATVVIDGYTHNSTLTSGDSVPLGTQIILVCRVFGLPYGTPLSYTWTCPNGDCVFINNKGRMIYKGHILAVNTTYNSYSGAYTCRVTARGGQANGSFRVNVTGMPLCMYILPYGSMAG